MDRHTTRISLNVAVRVRGCPGDKTSQTLIPPHLNFPDSVLDSYCIIAGKKSKNVTVYRNMISTCDSSRGIKKDFKIGFGRYSLINIVYVGGEF